MNFSKKNYEHCLSIKMMVNKTKLTLFMLFVSVTLIAQNGINYKAVIKDTNGNVVANQGIDIVFSIQHENVSIYSELQQIVTDNNGIAIATIGDGSAITGTFDTIDWKLRHLELNVQIDFGDGDGLVDFGNTQFNTVPYAINTLNPQGLEAIDEGNGIGWRLTASDSNNHGAIGQNAIDLSEQPTPSDLGATGELSLALGRYSEALGYSSFAMGDASRASGEQSLAFGEQSSASGDFSVSMGFSNLASGDYSSVFGRNNLAFGDYSFSAGQSNQISSGSQHSFAFGESNTIDGSRSGAFGFNNNISWPSSYAFGNDNDIEYSYSAAFGQDHSISGYNSYAFGYNNTINRSSSTVFGSSCELLGRASYAFGNNITTYSEDEVVIGQYNSSYNPVLNSTTWSNSNRLFVVANGYTFFGTTIRRNALTILKNGNTGIGTDNPEERLHITGRLRIGTETIEDTGTNRLSFNADLLPDSDNSFRLGNSTTRWTSVWAADGSINTSDRREKENITNLNYGLHEIMNLKPVSFNWKKRPETGVKLGLIAQDLQKIIPEVVMDKEIVYSEDDPTSFEKKSLDRLGVYYSDLIPVLIKAIQEQQKIITNQKEENLKQTSELTNINKTLKTVLSRIEILESKSSN